MNSKFFRWHSLKTRVTLASVVIFVTGIWALAFYASQTLRADMERLLGEQQSSTLSAIASDINDELASRLAALEITASLSGPTLQHNPAAMQAFIEQRQHLPRLFNGGVIAYGLDGTAIADSIPGAGRIGTNYMDVDTVSAALKHGRSTIGRPVLGKKLLAPVFGMTTPIRDAQGKVIGALAGVINLGAPNFLDRITDRRYGKTGGFMLVAPKYRQIITATDKSRSMELLPAPGINPLIDRHFRGDSKTVGGINSKGVEVLTSVERIPIADWYVSVALPTVEAFAPIRNMEQGLVLATLLLSLLAAALTWWMLKRQLAPMLAASKALVAVSASEQAWKPLPIARRDEVGGLIAGFNRLVDTWQQQGAALHKSESQLNFLVSASPIVLYTCATSHPYGATYISPNVTQYMGYKPEQFTCESAFWFDHIHPADRQHVLDDLPKLFEQDSHQHEYRFQMGDGSYHWMFDHVRVIRNENGEIQDIVGYWADITDRKQAESALLESEKKYRQIVENSPDIVYVFSMTKGGIYYSPTVLAVLGYSAEHLIANPFLWAESIHTEDRPVVAKAVEAFKKGTPFRIEYRIKDYQNEWHWLFDRSIGFREEGGDIVVEGLAMDITQHKQAENQIQQLAYYDPITGLPNRRLLMDRLQQALAGSARHTRQGALLMVDMDNFKDINDVLGHEHGDLVLQQVAKRLGSCIREGDTVARLGADEFVVLLAQLDQDALEAAMQAEIVGNKVLNVLKEPYQLNGSEMPCTASIGIALFGAQNEDTAEPLKRAELAMYQAKDHGRNTLRFFDPKMQAVVASRVAMEASLREAVSKDQLELHYQPQVTDQGRITGVEALLRWLDPKRGMVSPAEFIPMAEETGLILPIGNWVLETACKQLAQWANPSNMAHLTMAVNVSARQFHQRDFVDQVLMTLDRTGANPHLLKLELTESVLVEDVEGVIAKMSALQGRGVTFSLDDFGTGYSSLSYLQRLPLDQLKIDQGFIRNILINANDAAIARMVIALAESLGLTVIPEGVETEAQRDFLVDLGCHNFQGYLFSRPLPIQEFEEFAASGLQALNS